MSSRKFRFCSPASWEWSFLSFLPNSLSTIPGLEVSSPLTSKCALLKCRALNWKLALIEEENRGDVWTTAIANIVEESEDASPVKCTVWTVATNANTKTPFLPILTVRSCILQSSVDYLVMLSILRSWELFPDFWCLVVYLPCQHWEQTGLGYIFLDQRPLSPSRRTSFGRVLARTILV